MRGGAIRLTRPGMVRLTLRFIQGIVKGSEVSAGLLHDKVQGHPGRAGRAGCCVVCCQLGGSSADQCAVGKIGYRWQLHVCQQQAAAGSFRCQSARLLAKLGTGWPGRGCSASFQGATGWHKGSGRSLLLSCVLAQEILPGWKVAPEPAASLTACRHAVLPHVHS